MATLPQTANHPDVALLWRGRLAGLTLTLVLALIAWLLGSAMPLVGAPVFGIVCGLLATATGRVPAACKSGISFSSKQLLQAAIVLLGFGLSFGQIIRIGAGSLPVLFGTLIACLLAAWLYGRLLGTQADLTTLIGVGTAICGASAIGAVAPVIEAEEKDVAYAISTIFLFNVTAVLLFPPLGRLVGLTQQSFGLWAGTAVNDTSSVVAAAFSYGAQAGDYATVVKLTRATLIIPIALIIAGWRLWQARRDTTAASRPDLRRLVPWFILWFLAAALVGSAGFVPKGLGHAAGDAGKFLITVALTAVGLSANFRQMARTGLKPLLLGFLLWITVAASSLGIQALTGRLF